MGVHLCHQILGQSCTTETNCLKLPCLGSLHGPRLLPLLFMLCLELRAAGVGLWLSLNGNCASREIPGLVVTKAGQMVTTSKDNGCPCHQSHLLIVASSLHLHNSCGSAVFNSSSLHHHYHYMSSCQNLHIKVEDFPTHI